MLIRRAALVVTLMMLPLSSYAQKVAEGPPKTQEIQSVERGAYFSTEVGTSFIVNSIEGRSYGLGFLTGLFVGYDIVPFLSIEVGAHAFSAPGSKDDVPERDLLFLSPVAQVQLAVLTTERDFIWLRGGGGFGFGLPDEYAGSGPVFSGFVGYEHFTKLRHFSLGFQAGVLGVTKPDFGISISISPTLKYTF